jgi:hypothetical protein
MAVEKMEKESTFSYQKTTTIGCFMLVIDGHRRRKIIWNHFVVAHRIFVKTIR